MTSLTKIAPAQRADARRNREAVLEAARKQFAQHGLDCQMEDIARSAGVGWEPSTATSRTRRRSSTR
jgi:hypothetical protein